MTQTQSATSTLPPNACPCCSGAPLDACCLPILKGKRKAETAEQLLRARYTAFTRVETDYILATHHSRTRGDIKREEVEDWAKNSEWLGLEVQKMAGGQATDTEGQIIFLAKYRADGKEQEHWEHSFFEKENGEWRFLDAQGLQQGPIRRNEPKVGRNDPCTCGSGKKFKKCHGAA